MELREAIQQYRDVAGEQFQKPDPKQCYRRKSAWHILTKDGALAAVVFPDGRVAWGAVLESALREFVAGMAG